MPSEPHGDDRRDELNGRLLASRITFVTPVANDSRDPLRFVTEYRDEVVAVIDGLRIAGRFDAGGVRRMAHEAADELFCLNEIV